MDAPDQESALLSKLLTKAAVRSHTLEEFLATVGAMLRYTSLRVERVFLSLHTLHPAFRARTTSPRSFKASNSRTEKSQPNAAPETRVTNF